LFTFTNVNKTRTAIPTHRVPVIGESEKVLSAFD